LILVSGIIAGDDLRAWWGNTYEVVDNLRLAPLSWFTRTTFFYTPLMIELMIVAIVMRLLGLVQPFVFQAVIDRVLPFQREATLLLIVVVLGVTAILSAILDALAAYLGNPHGQSADVGSRRPNLPACPSSAVEATSMLAGWGKR
jgi:ABC-type bacteriocin/lantibiotic exporter with double-glycine peptidase domain